MLSISTLNATNTTVVAAGAEWNADGRPEDVYLWTGATLAVVSTQASVAGGVTVEWSVDGSEYDFRTTYSLNQLNERGLFALSQPLQHKARFFRVRIANSTAAEATLTVQCIHHRGFNQGESAVDSGFASGPSQSTAFGEFSVAETTAVIQLDGLYGITDTGNFLLNNALTGTQSVDDAGLMAVSSGTGSGAFATLRSKRCVRYHPGQGTVVRFTAMFPTGHTAGYQQIAGYLNQSDFLGVGYNFPADKAEIAVARRYASKAEIFKVTVLTATTATGTIDVTLDGVTFTVAVNPGSPDEVAAELSAASYTQWITDAVGGTVYFLYGGPPTNLNGAFSCQINTGATGFTCTQETLENGQSPTDFWTYQSEWNVDRLDGTGPSGMVLDPTKLNVFQIDFRWLGAGRVRYAIEDEATGQLVTFHTEHYVNKNTTPHLSNPSMRIGYGVVNAAPAVGTGTDVIVKGGSLMGGIQGQLYVNTTSSATRRTMKKLSSNDIHHVLSIKNDRINELGTAGKLNQREVVVETLAVGALANAGNIVTVLVYKNAEIDDGAPQNNPVNLIFTATGTAGISSSFTDGKYVAGTGHLITAFVVSSNSSANIDLTVYRMIMAPLDRVSVFVSCPAQVSPSVALTYQTE